MQAVLSGDDLAVLLQRCAAGDRGAFEHVYKSQAPRLYGLALSITRQPSSAADAVQEALLQVWRNAARFDPARGHAESWLIGLVRYRALDIARKHAREAPQDALPEKIDESPDALSQLMASSEGQALARCLDELPTERRRLIEQAFTQGLSHSELAGKLGEPLGTIKSWIRRSLQALRKCLTA